MGGSTVVGNFEASKVAIIGTHHSKDFILTNCAIIVYDQKEINQGEQANVPSPPQKKNKKKKKTTTKLRKHMEFVPLSAA